MRRVGSFLGAFVTRGLSVPVVNDLPRAASALLKHFFIPEINVVFPGKAGSRGVTRVISATPVFKEVSSLGHTRGILHASEYDNTVIAPSE